MARKPRRMRNTGNAPPHDGDFHFSVGIGALRGVVVGALFVAAGIGWLLSGGSGDSSSSSSTMSLRELPLLIIYVATVGGLACLGYLAWGWGGAIGLPCFVGAFVGGVGGAFGRWKLRRKL